MELLICGEEAPSSEVSPHLHDIGLVILMGQCPSKFELHVYALLGLPVDTTLRSPSALMTIRVTGESASGEGVRFTDLDEAFAQKGMDLRFFGKFEVHPRRHLGTVMAYADDT